jgi:hypothetical protein
MKQSCFRRPSGKFFCHYSYCCSQCKGTTFVKLTRIRNNNDDNDGTPYVPLQTIVIYCPTCFGTGRELNAKERLEFVRKQREREDAENKKVKRMVYNK